MRDQQQRARVAREPVLEPEHGVEVEVVGRLVEQQQVGAAHQRLREVEPHAPAAGEARDGLAVRAAREAEARQQRRGARARAVAVDAVEAMMQLGEALAAGVRIGGVRCGRRRQRALDRAQLARRRRARSRCAAATTARRLLRDVGDAPTPAAARRRRASASSSPRSSANRLDLPLPLAPISPTLCPGCTVSDAPSSRRLRAAGEREVGDAQHVESQSGVSNRSSKS